MWNDAATHDHAIDIPVSGGHVQSHVLAIRDASQVAASSLGRSPRKTNHGFSACWTMELPNRFGGPGSAVAPSSTRALMPGAPR
jgi:hypothetical protein